MPGPTPGHDGALVRQAMHCQPIRPILGSASQETLFRELPMSPTSAAARSTHSAPSLHDRLKDASLLREQCYIDGEWTGIPANPVTNPANGLELAKVPKMSTAEATSAVE